MSLKFSALPLSGLTALALLCLPAGGWAQTSPRQHIIFIYDGGFSRAPMEIRTGDTILWINRGASRHDATAQNGRLSVEVLPGRSVRIIAPPVGTYNYYCSEHRFAHGRFTVIEAEE